MRRLLVALATTLLFVLPSTPAGAIVNGEEDTEGRYPFVAMLAFYDEEGDYLWRCTGTLMSEWIVLTASHCTLGTSTARAYFDFEVTDDFRNDPQAGATGITYTHPGYNPNTLAKDVAVVELDEAMTGFSGLPTLPSERWLTKMKRKHKIQDDKFLAVGYGGRSDFPPGPPVIDYDLKRRFAVSSYKGLTRNNLHLQQNWNATGDGGTCFGDSGGPRFWKRTLKLVSVTSWGDAICRSNDMTQRTALPAVLDWLAEFGL